MHPSAGSVPVEERPIALVLNVNGRCFYNTKSRIELTFHKGVP